jgi:hypothetical protein
VTLLDLRRLSSVWKRSSSLNLADLRRESIEFSSFVEGCCYFMFVMVGRFRKSTYFEFCG